MISMARRFGTLRFMFFFSVTVAAGALAHLITHSGDLSPMIGASAAISGMKGAATRFAFQPGGPLDFWRPRGDPPEQTAAAPLWTALRNPRVITFVAVWFALNLLIPAMCRHSRRFGGGVGSRRRSICGFVLRLPTFSSTRLIRSFTGGF